MNGLAKFINSEFIYAIGWTLIHSLWQCSLVALCVVISYAFTKKQQASTRYWINVASLAICMLVSGITFYANLHDKISIAITESNILNNTAIITHEPYKQTLSGIINTHLNQIVFCWLVGFGLYICKYLADFFYCQRIKNHKNNLANEQWLATFNELKNNLGITRSVQLRISDIVDIPCVIGHFKPVVLLPASLMLGLSNKQVEVILLHELGHIRRNDYLISSIQTLVTSLYFFNPFVRWISSKIDEERENACDDIAISVCGDSLFYAHTLKEFAEMKSNYAPAVAMTGRKNQLLSRIKRLFIRDISFTKTYGKTLAVMALFLVGAGFSVSGYSTEEKAADDSFSVKLEKEPLSNLLKLAQDFCPNMPKDIQLKHGNQPITSDFPNMKCEWVEHFIKSVDDSLGETLTGIAINEEKISLKDLTQKIEENCPTLKGKVQLDHPEKIVGFQTPNLSCPGTEKILHSMDKEDTIKFMRQSEIKDIKLGGGKADDYAKAIVFKFPKDAIDKQYAADCTAIYSVDTNGKAFDVLPVCTNGTQEAQEFLEKHMKIAIEATQFPIKTENGKNIIVKNKEVKAKWKFWNPDHPTIEKAISN